MILIYLKVQTHKIMVLSHNLCFLRLVTGDLADGIIKKCIDLWGNNTGYAYIKSKFYHYNYDMNECNRASASDNRQCFSSLFASVSRALLGTRFHRKRKRKN